MNALTESAHHIAVDNAEVHRRLSPRHPVFGSSGDATAGSGSRAASSARVAPPSRSGSHLRLVDGGSPSTPLRSGALAFGPAAGRRSSAAPLRSVGTSIGAITTTPSGVRRPRAAEVGPAAAALPLRHQPSAIALGVSALDIDEVKYWLRRAAALSLLVILAYGLASAAVRSLGSASASAGDTAGVSYVVRPGDTAWSIVQDYGYEGDVRDGAQRLLGANGGAELRAGDSIVVPYELLAR